MPNEEQKEPRKINYPSGLLKPVLKTPYRDLGNVLDLHKRMVELGVPCRITRSSQAVVSLTAGENKAQIAELIREYRARLCLNVSEMIWGSFGSVVCSGIGGTLEAFYASSTVDQHAGEQVFARFSLRQDDLTRCLLVVASTKGEVGVCELGLVFDAETNTITPTLKQVTDRTAILARAINHAKNRARNPQGLWPFCSNTRELRPTRPRRLIDYDVDE